MLLVEKTRALWPQTVLELLTVLHEKIKTNIHLISIKLMHLKNISIIIKTVLCSSFEFENFVESVFSVVNKTRLAKYWHQEVKSLK